MLPTGGNGNNSLKTGLSTTFFTTKLAGTLPLSNLGLHFKKSATNPLSHDTVLFYPIFPYFRRSLSIWKVAINLDYS